MDEQRARFLLQSGPPRAGDREDPAFIEALAQAEADPSLGDWTRRQQELTEAMSAKLNEIDVPAHLKSHILAGGHVSQRNRQYRRRGWLALAAAATVFLSLAAWQWGGLGFKQANFTALRADMCEFLAGSFSLEVQAPSLARLQAHLGEQYDFTGYTVPANLAAQRGVGCRVIEWRGRQVALICFSVQGQLVHLLILPRSQLPADTLPERTLHESLGEWATAGWTDDQNVYLVATRGTPELIAGLL